MATVTALPTTDTAWSRTVHQVAATARAAYPSLGGKIEQALALVLAAAIEPLGEQEYLVASQSDPTGLETYSVLCGKPTTCTCKDYDVHRLAPDYRCKHIVAVWIWRRSTASSARDQGEPAQAHGRTEGGVLKTESSVLSPLPPPAQEPAPAASAPALPEAAFSITLKGTMSGHEVLLTARGQTWEAFAANVARLQGMLDAPEQEPGAGARRGLSCPGLRTESAALSAQSSTRSPLPAASSETPVCQWHGGMKESTKAKGTWYCPAKMADGSYCKSRHPEKG